MKLPHSAFKRRWNPSNNDTPPGQKFFKTMRHALTLFPKEEYSPAYLDDLRVAVDRWEEFGIDLPPSRVGPGALEEFTERLRVAKMNAVSHPDVIRCIIRRVKGTPHPGNRQGKPLTAWPAVAELDDTLWSWFCVVYCPERLFNRSESQRKNHRIAQKHLAAFLGRRPVLADLTNVNISGMMEYLVSIGRAPRTANRSHDCLCALWTFLAKRPTPGVAGFPSVGLLVEPETVPRAWTKSELRTLYKTCEAQQGWIGGVPARLWWHAIHALLWDTGERIGALHKLRWDQVDLRARVVTYLAQNRKGGRKANQKPIHRQTVAVLREMQAANSEFVLSRQFCVGTLYNRYDKLLREAGLSHGRDSKFHKMRKSSASWFEAAGGNATDFLGHSSRRVTLRYLDPIITEKKRPCDKLFRFTGK